MQPCLAFNHKLSPPCGGFLWDFSDLMHSQVPYLLRPRSSMRARQPSHPPWARKAAGLWIWPWHWNWKEQGLLVLGKKPVPSHNLTQWSDGDQHSNTLLTLWSKKLLPSFKKKRKKSSLSMLSLSCMVQENPYNGCNKFCSNISLVEDPEPNPPELHLGYTLVMRLQYRTAVVELQRSCW